MGKVYRKADLKAPRFRRKSISIIDDDFCNRFRDKFPEYKNIDNKTIRKAIETFNGKLWEGVINNRDGIELPESLGYIFIGSCPSPVRKPIDVVKSRLYGQVITHKNYDTDGHLMKIFYTNTPVKYRLKNKQIWAFSPIRNFSRTASKQFRTNWTKYVVIKKNDKISGNFKGYNERKKYLKYVQKINP